MAGPPRGGELSRRSEERLLGSRPMPDLEDVRELWEVDLELAGSDQGPIPIITTPAERDRRSGATSTSATRAPCSHSGVRLATSTR